MWNMNWYWNQILEFNLAALDELLCLLSFDLQLRGSFWHLHFVGCSEALWLQQVPGCQMSLPSGFENSE